MSDVGTAPAASVGAAERLPASPPARRLEPPRWRDGRLLAGVLLLLVSVVVGARVLSTGGATAPVVALARDLPAGHVLAAGDLRVVRVRLDGRTAGQYVGGAQLDQIAGRPLGRGAGAGELLAVGAIGQVAAATPQRLVPVTVAAGRLPGLSAGDHVDVYATGLLKPSAGGAEQCTTQVVATDVEIGADVDATVASGTTTVLLRVDPRLAGTLVHASETAALDVTRHLPVGDQQGDTGTAAVQGLGSFTTTSCGGK